jgi:hypothetical protein
VKVELTIAATSVISPICKVGPSPLSRNSNPLCYVCKERKQNSILIPLNDVRKESQTAYNIDHNNEQQKVNMKHSQFQDTTHNSRTAFMIAIAAPTCAEFETNVTVSNPTLPRAGSNPNTNCD